LHIIVCGDIIFEKGKQLTKEVTTKHIIIYADVYGNEPYINWLNDMRDKQTQQRIRTRVRRLESGLYGDVAPVGEGVSELRLFFGAGYRVYFGEQEGQIIVLLCGGDKSTQKDDIEQAKAFWKEYKNHANI
jgi:putative addiction module killer protein